MKARILIVLAAFAASPVAAQSPAFEAAVQAGVIGERYDGYMGFVATPPPELRRQVAAVNLRRRNLYIELSTRRNVTAQVVGVATGCELLGRLSVGEAYMLKDGVWRRRAAGEPPPQPDYCAR